MKREILLDGRDADKWLVIVKVIIVIIYLYIIVDLDMVYDYNNNNNMVATRLSIWSDPKYFEKIKIKKKLNRPCI